jgi:site-specific recombinase XerD
MTVRKRGKKWYYDFGGHKYRGVIPLARTKHEAVQAEIKIKREVFDETFGAPQIGNESFSEFALNEYLTAVKDEKRSWRTYEYITRQLAARFQGLSFNDISAMLVAKLKHDLINSQTRQGTVLSASSVNSALSICSGIFTFAIDRDKAVKNPCRQVKLLKLRNQTFRYLLPDEQPALLSAIANPLARISARGKISQGAEKIRKERAHLLTMVPVAVGTGARKTEQLRLQVKHCDFARDVVILTDTKNGETREVPMNDDVRSILSRLCQGKHRDAFVWTNTKTKTRFLDIKRGFTGACRDARIEGLQWKHLRATFGTRLGAAGFSAFEIMALMGHGDIRMSQRYVRATEGRKREAVQATMLRKVAVA